VYLLSQIAFYSFAPLYAIFAADLHLSLKSISFIWSGYSLLTAAFILLMGKLENNKHKGQMLVVGYSIYCCGSLSFLLVHNAHMLLVALCISALAAGVTFPAYKTMFANSQSVGKESEQWAWLDAGNMFAAAAGAGIGGLIVSSFGFTGLFLGIATMQLFAAFVAHRQFYYAR
jgi:MFS family permease